MDLIEEVAKHITSISLLEPMYLHIEFREIEYTDASAADDGGHLPARAVRVRITTNNRYNMLRSLEEIISVEMFTMNWVDEVLTRLRSAVIHRWILQNFQRGSSPALPVNMSRDHSSHEVLHATIYVHTDSLGIFFFEPNLFRPTDLIIEPSTEVQAARPDIEDDAARSSIDLPHSAVDGLRGKSANSSDYWRVILSVFDSPFCQSAPSIQFVVHHMQPARFTKGESALMKIVEESAAGQTILPHSTIVQQILEPLNLELVPINKGKTFVVSVFAASGRLCSRLGSPVSELIRSIRVGRVLQHLMAFIEPQILCSKDVKDTFKAAVAVQHAVRKVIAHSRSADFQERCSRLLHLPSMSTLSIARALAFFDADVEPKGG